MKKYFINVETLEQLRRQYKELLKKFHPDNANGSTEATQEINAEYDKLFKVLKDGHESKSADSNRNTASNAKADYNSNTYDWENDKALREVLQKIINFNGIEIDLIGAWIWIDGNTYPYKESLKEYGFRWSQQRHKWYWHDGEFRRHGNNKLSYLDIQKMYGSTSVHTIKWELLEA